MSEQSMTYQPSGNPGLVGMIATQANEFADDEKMGAGETAGATLALVHVLAIELADALRRITELERELRER